ncbi:smad nuclear-interacting protein 1-like [Watersipora subatra]|uniref:smad nuclear-interacting protein 1-like n=1 Tax=Watersipora subatra TaxID=2589382 RepID=UPI00355BB03C
MPSDHKSTHRYREKRPTSRSRSRSVDRSERRSKIVHSHSKHMKREKLTPEKSIKKERITPERRTKWERESPERAIKREKVSPDRHHSQRTEDRHEGRREVRHEDRHEGRREDRHKDDKDSYRHERRRNEGQRMRDKRKRRQEDVDDSKFKYGKPEQETQAAATGEEDKSKPDYGLSGKLADDTNTYRGVVVKYNEPPEARKPKLKWRLYPFKGDTAMPVLHIHRQSGYLLGRDRKVADIPVDHPSCSKQHAVLQFRSVEYTKDDGMKGRRTRPYIMDLGSANGTFVNNKQIEAQRYVELLEKDTIKFGFSSRDYVILHDNVDVSPSGSDAVD